jgi:DNA-directed RNA polymerase specialized sigma24 family protein
MDDLRARASLLDDAEHSEADTEALIRYCYGIAKRLYPRAWNSIGKHDGKVFLDFEDALQEAVIACWRKRHQWDPQRGPASVFFGYVVRSTFFGLRKRAYCEIRTPTYLRVSCDDFDTSTDARLPASGDGLDRCSRGHVLDEENTYWHHRADRGGKHYPSCRICRRERKRAQRLEAAA